MAQLAAERTGKPVAYEISVTNVDKPPLDYLEMQARASQFSLREILYFTRAPRFTEKARIFPAATFVVGADTLARIAEPRYYRDTVARDTAIDEFAAHAIRFLVFGRTEQNRFVTLDDLELPPPLRDLCDGVGADEFREDVSSTAIRESIVDTSTSGESATPG